MTENRTNKPNSVTVTGLEIAVIGMSCRFPGAKNTHEFWDNLKNGVESISFFSNEEMEKQGMGAEVLKDPKHIKAKGIFKGIEYFDASFFGYNPREAELMDPQMRIFHECAWEALEDAGYDTESYDGLIGLFAGAAHNHYWEGLGKFSGKSDEVGQWSAYQLVDKDYMTLWMSYTLNLIGPSFSIYTACSTSLVAIHLACQAILNGECDMALAGGVTLILPQKTGYFYTEGMVMSPDGHCRAFDARGNGTIFGDGAGIVALKRWEDAAAQGDHIYAIIKGSAINNDGIRKTGFTAPGIEGQVEVLRAAMQMSHLEPESIGYLEAHASGTTLGDPIEAEALTLAFNTPERNFCGLGAVKTNIGHLDAAAGVAGFIKTVLAITHRLIPPTLHFEHPNPEIDFENSPFYVNQESKKWQTDKYPLRAGVSSFGIGGTNAHVVLEETPVIGHSSLVISETEREPEYQLILLSAKTPTALDQMTKNLVEYFKNPVNPGQTLADAAYTLQVGRRAFRHRRMLVCSRVNEAIEALSSQESGKVQTSFLQEENKHIIFLFPGVGEEYVNMGLDLYRCEPLFREETDRCFEIVKPLIGFDIKEILYPGISVSKVSEESSTIPGSINRSNGSYESYNPHTSHINQPEIAQVAVFILEYALAKLLMKWGIKPDAMMGYSFGEYTAACISGIFSLEDALNIVVFRSQSIKETPRGAMLSIPLPKNKLQPLLNQSNLSLAIDNGQSCIVSGLAADIDNFEKQMKKNRYICARLAHASRAIHSHIMAPISERFKKKITGMILKKPNIPYISDVSGTWISDEEAVNPQYWANHLRQTVQFADGMKTLLKTPGAIFVEIGPGRNISTLASRHIEIEGNTQHQVLNLVRSPHQDISDVYCLLNRIGRLWLYGQSIDWTAFYGEEKNRRNRISLPTYPFDRQRYWIDEKSVSIDMKSLKNVSPLKRPGDIDQWFYLPSWKRSPIPIQSAEEKTADSCWLVFIDDCGLGVQLVKQLEKEAKTVVTVKTGGKFFKENDRIFSINPQEDNDYHVLFDELNRLEMIPGNILHLWGVTSRRTNPLKPGTGTFRRLDSHEAGNAQELGFYSLLNIAQSMGKQGFKNRVQLTVVTNNMQEVIGRDGLYPEKATVLGPVKVIPTEYINMKCRSLDVVLPEPLETGNDYPQKLLKQLRDEFISEADESVVAYRGDYRWVQTYEPRLFQDPGKALLPLKQSGVYLITGGLGGIGLALAQYLAIQVRAKLLLTGRREFPPRSQWEQLLTVPGSSEKLKEKIQKIKAIEEAGAEVMVFNADVSHMEQMQQVIARAEEHFGPINGIIHCSGLPDGEMIQRRSRETSKRILQPKVEGSLVLDHLLHLMKEKPDFFILCSSVVSIVSTFGQAGYSAANAFLDAFAHYRNFIDSDGKHTLTVSINWDRWQGIGIANIMEAKHKELTGQEMEGGFTIQEGVEVFHRILGDLQSQVITSTRDLGTRIQQSREVNASSFMKELKSESANETLLPRPNLVSEYVPPANETEQIIAKMWATFLKIKQAGVKDDFFELGGDSLKALILLPRIQKELNVEIPIAEFFRRPTIQKLSEYINGADKSTFFSIESTEKKEYYALSSAQQRLFILQQMAPSSSVYNESLVEVFDRNLAKNQLEEVFRKLIKRHESLRTSFTLLAGESVQQIHDDVAFEIEYDDMKKNSVPESREPGARSSISSFTRPFDLSRAPLLRVGLFQPEKEKYLLVVDMHHIISDGISIDLIIRDFNALYDDRELADLRIQYKDFVEWQSSKRVRERIMQQEGYWLKRFEGEIPVLSLAADFTRPPEQSYEGKTRKFKISQEQTRQLKVLIVQEDVTLFMKLVTIFYIFLFKISGQEDIVVGTPIAGRQHWDLENIIGMFANTLALRNYPNAGKTFNGFLKEVKETTLGDFQHQEYPFEQLIDKLNVDRDISRNPIFDVMFILHTMETREEIEKLYNYERNVSRFDLTLQAFEVGKNLFFKFEYCTKLFDEGTIDKFIGYFKNIISSIIDLPHQELWEVDIMTDAEKNRLLYSFNHTEVEFPKDNTIQQLFTEQAERTPDHIALIGVGMVHVTYLELNEKSRQLAYLLQKKGVQPGVIVGIMLERSIEMIVGILAILKASGAYMPIAPDYPKERIDYMLKDSNAGVLLTTSELQVKVRAEVEENTRPPQWLPLQLVHIESELAPAFGPSPLTSIPTCRVGPANLAYIIYTSGSTGQPKGVMVDQVSIVNTLYALERMYPFSPGDVYLMKTSYLFDVSLSELFGWFWGNREGRLVLLESGGEKEPEKILDTIEKMNITRVNFVPSMFDVFLDRLKPGNMGKLSSLKYIFLAGEALTPELVNRFRDLNSAIILENLYGPTEVAIYTSRYSLAHWEGGRVVPIGKPLQNIKLYIKDCRSGLQPVGVPGELCIGGIGVARGYLNNPQLTAEKFARDLLDYRDHQDEGYHRSNKSYKSYSFKRIYKTGDWARWLAEGNIEFLGRNDHQVKIRGFRIEPGEIESKIQSHSRIKKAVVVTLEKNGNKYLSAYYVSEDGGVNPLELKQFLTHCLPDYMIPVYFVPMEAIPMTLTGKLDRGSLPDPEVKLLEDDIKPNTPMEKTIAEIWKEVLGIDKIGVHTRFFDLGGNSVNILRVHSKLQEAIRVNFPLMVIFKYPTVFSLSGYLSSEGIERDHIITPQPDPLNLEKSMMKQTLQKLGTGINRLPRE